MAGDGETLAFAAAEIANKWLNGSLLLPLQRWSASDGGGELLGAAWDAVRAGVVAPALTAASGACLAMSAMLLAEAVFIAAASLARRRPERRYRAEPLGACEDEESGLLGYPMVLVQIPMYNEREVYKLSIGAACELSWPSDRVIVQVLDDSTDPTVKDLVELECKLWAKKGKNVKYEVRTIAKDTRLVH